MRHKIVDHLAGSIPSRPPGTPTLPAIPTAPAPKADQSVRLLGWDPSPEPIVLHAALAACDPAASNLVVKLTAVFAPQANEIAVRAVAGTSLDTDADALLAAGLPTGSLDLPPSGASTPDGAPLVMTVPGVPEGTAVGILIASYEV